MKVPNSAPGAIKLRADVDVTISNPRLPIKETWWKTRAVPIKECDDPENNRSQNDRVFKDSFRVKLSS
tara:strand:- start:81 stop:284 length:204 start_codon:yes stop_codon:yes gene_type:complete